MVIGDQFGLISLVVSVSGHSYSLIDNGTRLLADVLYPLRPYIITSPVCNIHAKSMHLENYLYLVHDTSLVDTLSRTSGFR